MNITLALMVKDCADVLRVTIPSWRKLITSWVILDTGSTDATEAVVQELLGDLPGQFIKTHFRDFATSRNELMALAEGKGDYLLIPDADEQLNVHGLLPELGHECYMVRFEGALDWRRPMLIRGDMSFKYFGVCHEYLAKADGTLPTRTNLDAITMTHLGSGSTIDKNLRNLTLLEQGLKDEPTNPRYMFYLAQTHFEGGRFAEALGWYRQRVAAGGWEEEVFYAHYRAGLCLSLLGKWPEAEETLLRAWEGRPTRIEPLLHIARHYREAGLYHTGLIFAQRCVAAAYPTDLLFVERAIYLWEAPLELGICHYWTGNHKEAIRINDQIIAHPETPKEYKEGAARNTAHSRKALSKGK